LWYSVEVKRVRYRRALQTWRRAWGDEENGRQGGRVIRERVLGFLITAR